MMSGEGLLSFYDGKKYKGSFSNNEIRGEGTMSHSDGRTFIGNWVGGLMEGEGLFHDLNEIVIKDNGRIIKLMEKELITILMGTFMKVNGKMV